MEINPQRSTNRIETSRLRRKPTHSSAAAELAGPVAFLGSDLLQAIEAGLAALPEIRQERMDEGRQLAGDPKYPAADQLDELARLAMENFTRPYPPEDKS